MKILSVTNTWIFFQEKQYETQYRHEHDVEVFNQELTADLRKKHPIRASAETWIEHKSEKQSLVFRKTNNQQWQQKRRTKLQEKGLKKQLQLVDIELAHPLPTTPGEHQHWQQKWQARQPPKAARKFLIRRTLWKKQGTYVPADKPAEEGRFVVQHKVNYTLDSTTPLWRLRLLGARSAVWSNNALRWGFVDRIWDGRFGLRTQFGDLFGHRQVIIGQIIDPISGQISADPNGPIYYSYSKRIGAVWTRLKKRRKHFEAHHLAYAAHHRRCRRRAVTRGCRPLTRQLPLPSVHEHRLCC